MIDKVVIPSNNFGDILENEPNIINMQLNHNESIFNNDASSIPNMNNVLRYAISNENEENKNNYDNNIDFTNYTFYLKCSTLNSLLFKKLRHNNMNHNHENEIIQNNSNGTCVSIRQWGVKNGLDNEQQMAFELITGTFILSFFDNLEPDIIDMTSLIEEENNLKLMVKKKVILVPCDYL